MNKTEAEDLQTRMQVIGIVNRSIQIQDKKIAQCIVTVFGHTNELLVQLWCPVWKPNTQANYQVTVNLNGRETAQTLNEVLQKLSKIVYEGQM